MIPTTIMTSVFSPGDLPGLAPSISVAYQLQLGLLWQNAGKTIPAVADGDPVRVATCPWTGEDYTAPSDAARPLLYDQGGGTWSLRGDGVDDVLVYAAFAEATPVDVWGAFDWRDVGGIHFLFGLNTGTDGVRAYGCTGTNLGESSAKTGGSFFTWTPATGPRRWGFSYNGASSAVYQDGASIATGTTDSVTCQGLTVFGVTDGGGGYTYPADLDVYALIPAAGPISASSRTALDAYLTALLP